MPRPDTLDDALDRLHTIHAQLARTERLRNVRAMPVAASAGIAAGASLAQQAWIADPRLAPAAWLWTWLGAAGASASLALGETHLRIVRARGSRHGYLDGATTMHAWEQFAPSLFVGAVWTAFVWLRQPELIWLLPGAWQLLFGVGCLSAWRLLPRSTAGVGVFYLLSGTACLWAGERALAPWAMGVPFAVGQAVLAAILHRHGREEQP